MPWTFISSQGSSPLPSCQLPWLIHSIVPEWDYIIPGLCWVMSILMVANTLNSLLSYKTALQLLRTLRNCLSCYLRFLWNVFKVAATGWYQSQVWSPPSVVLKNSTQAKHGNGQHSQNHLLEYMFLCFWRNAYPTLLTLSTRSVFMNLGPDSLMEDLIKKKKSTSYSIAFPAPI